MHAYFMRGKATPQRPADGALALRFSNPMLGIMDDLERPVVDGLVAALLDQRQQARARKDFAAADAMRDRLTEVGLKIEDTPHGPRWSLAK